MRWHLGGSGTQATNAASTLEYSGTVDKNGFGKAPEESASDDRRTSDPTQPLGDQMGQNVERNLVGEPQRLVPATECEFRRGLIR